MWFQGSEFSKCFKRRKYGRIDCKANYGKAIQIQFKTKKLQDIALQSKDSLIIRKTKWIVSVPEECSWCDFGISSNWDLKIVYRENSTSCKHYIKERLASEPSRKSSSPSRTKSYTQVAIQKQKKTKETKIFTKRLFSCNKKLETLKIRKSIVLNNCIWDQINPVQTTPETTNQLLNALWPLNLNLWLRCRAAEVRFAQ